MAGTRIRHIAALGSSFAAGPGIEPVADRRARRSARNYPHLLAERLGATLTDLTVSGATTKTIIDTPQRVLFRKFPPQLHGLPADAALVTITAGGNDLGYISSMMRLGLSARLASGSFSRPMTAVLRRRGVLRPAKDDMDQAAANLAHVVEEARRRAEDARVLLVDYLTVIGPDTCPSREAPFEAERLEEFRRLGDQVAEVFARAARRTGAELVAVGEISHGHAVGSAEPWGVGLGEHLRGSGVIDSFHPNIAGMCAVADAITEHL
ncbi:MULTISPECIES: SGNH/GDSL hydrolase family protein [unclassified Streptomyces]|uniref:SGNH/GDSL hydrolase family protein n=1 Tax=unclassified Streptomyces TaxID=2593676 RepID=UPI00336A906E